ncbi:MAG TPA: FkbM family methyltransferase [Pyrinomonadaceae bacterium]|nr:FkbM family methyltransferase [Pyrinomonadaceae bacterium]
MKLSGLFINCVKAQDSIFESGIMTYQCLLGSDKFSLDYVEISQENLSIPTNYDFYLFNYHPVTMSWLDAKSLKSLLPGLVLTVVLEVSPNNPFVFCSPNDFDGYIVLDPTLNIANNKAFAFPRPLEVIENLAPYQEKPIPVIGSFGFATKGKGFEHLIDAVNKEFDEAVVKINIPFSTYADESRNYAQKLAEICKNRAKNGIEVIVTHEFFSKPELIEWCSQNTLNCFLYDRNMPGLAATTDQAISSGRPLITSKNNTFRHLQKYIKPFPYQSLKDAIKNTEIIVKQIQKDWSAKIFREKFEDVLNSYPLNYKTNNEGTVELRLVQSAQPFTDKMFEKIKDTIAIRTRLENLKNHRTLRRKIKEKVNPVVSHSQFGEDIIINNLFREIPITNISYLDIGANNPKYISNTFSFYEQGFTGVLVEPNPHLCEKLRSVRPKDTVVNVGIGTDENITEADFYMFGEEADGLSTFSEKEAKYWETVGLGGKKFQVEHVIKMSLMNINQVIEKYFTEFPDFISIDVEGWDLKILQTFDFEKYTPAVFCVETLAYKDDGSTYRLTEINDFFEQNGYFSFHQTYANDIFVNQNLYDFYLYQKEQRSLNQ